MINLFENQKVIFKYRKNYILNGETTFPDGQKVDWTTAKFQDSVSILPVYEDGKFIVIKQWRPAIQAWSYEQPAGGIEEGLTKEENARRELLEEIGYKPKGLQFIRDLYFTCGLMNFSVAFFIAYCNKEDYVGEQREQFEHINTMYLTFDEILDLIMKGENVDPELITSLLIFNNLDKFEYNKYITTYYSECIL